MSVFFRSERERERERERDKSIYCAFVFGLKSKEAQYPDAFAKDYI